MELLDCTEEELKIYNKEFGLTLNTWRMAEPEDIYMIKIDGEIVALIEFSKGMYGEKSIQIDNFEVFNKGKGIGSKIVKELTKDLDGLEIYLYPSSNKSEAFWKKHKFEGIDDGTETIILRYSD
ncbi:GNAT family N-acetyltransferase [Bacillus sp. FSL W7-1294]|uniref:GNAT family N-acetyltransferase n=1 Tax=Bacillus TaxID=1386 RepID=UPI00077A6C98|nr:GNAT family N-acetyltransferase [Bacillus cereus]KXY73131.1 hypothetical protein AT270_04240 [Bacillus cereus]